MQLGGLVGDLGIGRACRSGAALHSDSPRDPAPRDRLQLIEQVIGAGSLAFAEARSTRRLARCMAIGARPHVVQLVGRDVTPSPTMPSSSVLHGPDQLRRESAAGESAVNSRRDLLVGQLRAVAGDAREADARRLALLDREHARDRSSAASSAAHDRLGGEVERNAEDVGIFDVEQLLIVQVVGLPPQRRARPPARTAAGCRRRARRGCG